MKKLKNLVIGGIENKVFNLVLFTVFLIVLAFVLVIRYQSKELSDLAAETNRKQQESIERISAQTMQTIMDGTMADTALMQADLTNDMMQEVKNNVRMLADYATKLYAEPEGYEPMDAVQPEDFSGTEHVLTWLHAENVDPGSERSRQEIGMLSNMGDMMLSLLNNSEYLGACYIATSGGLTLMCDDAASSKESADVDYVFDSRNRPWYIGADRTGSRYFTGVERDFYTDRVGITCSVPVYRQGRLVAVVGGDLYLDGMEQSIRESESETGFCFIVNSKGNVIFSPKTEGIFHVALAEDAKDLRDPAHGELAKVVQASLKGNSGITEVECDGRTCYMAGAPVRTVGWAVIIAVYKDAAQAPTIEMQKQHQAILEQATAEYQNGISKAKKIMVLMLVILGLIVFVNGAVLARKIVGPLNRMTNRIANLSAEDPAFEMTDEYRSGDEIEALAKSFSQLSKRTREYMEENLRITAEKERIGAELNVATRIQADMLPRIFPPFPERKEFDLYASMDPAKEVGGDFYDFFLIDEDHLAMVMADVSGKGVPAALFMVIAKTLIKNRAQMGGSPAEILADVNRQLCEGNSSGVFVTVWFAILQISTGQGLAANAGHEHPILRHADGAFEMVEYKHSPPLGLLEDIPCPEHPFTLQKGDTVFVYTDGVTEASTGEKKLFGTKQMLEALNEQPEAEPKTILEHMTLCINEFVGEAEQFDDITMLCLKYYG